MSRKYIKQLIDRDFVYPNKDRYIYDTEMVHSINDNTVTGVVSVFTPVSVSSSSITISLNITWNKNGAEPFISDSNFLHYASVHGMADGQLYYKPWVTLAFYRTSSLNVNTVSATSNFVLTPDMFGLNTFSNGMYYFEVRFIGKRSVFPVCVNLDIDSIPEPSPSPTPTPTVTPTSGEPTPTPTVTPTVTPTITPSVVYWYTLNSCGEDPSYSTSNTPPIASQRYVDPISGNFWVWNNVAPTTSPLQAINNSLQVVSGQSGCP